MKKIARSVYLPRHVRDYKPMMIVAYFTEKALESMWSKEAINRVIKRSTSADTIMFFKTLDEHVVWQVPRPCDVIDKFLDSGFVTERHYG